MRRPPIPPPPPTAVFLLFLCQLLMFTLPLPAAANIGEGGGSDPVGDDEGVRVTLPGQIVLGGLFPVHKKSSDKNVPCSHAIYNRGIQRLEAMLYAVDTINQDDSILRDISLGVNILDTCGLDTYALNQSLEFIRASLNDFDVSQYECSQGGPPKLKVNTTGPVKGVIGGSYSSVSIQVANLLQLFRIPQVSPASTAKALSDKTRFEMFARTVPPDTFQAIALVDIVKKFNWTYVSTIASEGSYGESGIDVFAREADRRNICIAIAEKVPSDADEKTFSEIVSHLLKKPQARVIVLFTRAEDARGILMAARALTRSGDISPGFFTWLASDGWGKQSAVVNEIQEFAVGAITVELESKKIHGFDGYMNRLTPFNNHRNPWFRDYWQESFGCRIPHDDAGRRQFLSGPGGGLSPLGLGGVTATANTRRAFAKTCDMRKRLKDLTNYEQDSKVQFVIDAVYAFAIALDKLREDACLPSQRGMCPQMAHYDGGQFYKNYLLKVDFTDIANSTVKFDNKGDGLARYTIFNYQRDARTGKTDYKIVGKWHNELNMNVEDVVWTAYDQNGQTSARPMTTLSPLLSNESRISDLHATQSTSVPSSKAGDGRIPTSVCSEPCKAGEIMIMNTGDTCCWVCQRCQKFEFVKDVSTCEDCGSGRWPVKNYSSCYDLELQYIRWDSIFAVVPVCVSSLGIVLTVVAFAIFYKNRDTPLVRASGRELSYVLLFGLLMCYLNTFILLAKPGTIVCLLQRFTVGMGFSAMYGALLTKTNRIARIFQSATQSSRRPSYISPKSQLVITAVLVSVQFFGTLVWAVTAFPGAERVTPRREEVILKCNVDNSSFLISQVYNMILVTICTYYAIRTRKVPENFNEAKFIGFTMYTTCIIWLAFIPIYFGTGNSFEIQITTLCISISLSAYVTLFCLFSPKIYIIVFQPEKNVRKLTMNSAAGKKNTASLISAKPDRGGNSCGGASSSGSGPTVTPKSLAVNSHSYGQTSVSATPKTTVTITTAANGGTASTANSATAEEGTTNVMVNQMPPDGRRMPPVKTLEQAETQPVIKSAMAHSPSASLSSSTQLHNKPYITKRISFNDGDGRPPSQRPTTSFAKAAPPPQPSIKAKETLPGKVTSPQEGRYLAPKEDEVDDDEDDGDDDDEEESSRPTSPCSACEKANGGVGSRCHRYDEECDDCRRAETALNIANGSEDGRTILLGEGHAYDDDDDDDDDDEEEEENGEGSISIGRGGPCNGGVIFHRRAQSEHNTPRKKNMGTSTASPTLAAPRNAPNFALDGRGKKLTALPRGSSSTQLLLDDDYGVGSTGSATFDSRQSLCEDSLVPGSPRHLMTYVNSSRETIPLEIAQDIPDVML